MIKKEKPKYVMTVHLTGARQARHEFFTIKSARHYAKMICENWNVTRVSLSGPDTSVTLYECD
jgi:hypothetical protein